MTLFRLDWCSKSKFEGHSRSLLNRITTERWPSGLRRRFAKPLYGQKLYLGFESLPLRQIQYLQYFARHELTGSQSAEASKMSRGCPLEPMPWQYLILRDLKCSLAVRKGTAFTS